MAGHGRVAAHAGVRLRSASIFSTPAGSSAIKGPSNDVKPGRLAIKKEARRYGTLAVTNTSASACTVSGYPGFGARGAWGHAFQLLAEQTDISPNGTPTGTPVVELAPGEAARASVEWTGELAGAESEPASSLVVQLAQGQPARLVAPGDTDIGMLTTVRIGALLPAA